MQPTARNLLAYRTGDGRVPFDERITGLRDKAAIAHIFARLARIRLGNLGDCKPVGEGVSELRVDYGPGYRIYFGQDGPAIVILLCGGDKKTQARDIRLAKQYWHKFKESK